MKTTAFKAQSGFTIHELLVVLNVSFLLVSFSLMLFLSISEFVASWQKKNELRDTVNRIVQRMALDVQRSELILAITDTSLSLGSMKGKDIHYRVMKKGVFRDGVSMITSVKMTMDMKITSLDEPVWGKPSRLVRIHLLGKSGNYEYGAVAEVAIAPSAVNEFNITKTATF